MTLFWERMQSACGENRLKKNQKSHPLKIFDIKEHTIMGRLFSADGVRGVAGHDLTCELAMKLGRAALPCSSTNQTRHPRVIISKDTRLSSDMLENAMAAGLSAA